MSPLVISLVAFVCIFGGTLFGMFLRNILPEHHLSDESKDAVKLGIGMIATLAALVLGLLVASAKGTFDTASTGLRQTGARVILLDRVLAHYGPETMEARELLRRLSPPPSNKYGRRIWGRRWLKAGKGWKMLKPSRTNSASSLHV